MFGIFSKKNNTTSTRRPNLMAGQDDYTFRRSRTLTGSVSPQVAVSAQPRSQLKTDRLKVHELKLRRRRLLHALGSTLLCAGIACLLLSSRISPTVAYYAQASQGIHRPDTAAYEKSMQDYFKNHPFEIFSFSLNVNQLSGFINQQHPEIASVYAERSDFGLQTHLGVVLRKPLLAWTTPGGKFYVDNTGAAFTKNFFSTSLVDVVDRSGVTPEADGTIASKRFIRFLGQLVGAVNSGGKGKVSSVIIPASTREIDLRLEKRDYDIKTHIDRDPNQQAEDVARALAFIDQKGIKPQYVDVRVPNRAFYRDK